MESRHKDIINQALNYNLKEYCATIAQTIKQGTGIPVSIGVAPIKTLAKVANKYAKKYSAYNQNTLIITILTNFVRY